MKVMHVLMLLMSPIVSDSWLPDAEREQVGRLDVILEWVDRADQEDISGWTAEEKLGLAEAIHYAYSGRLLYSSSEPLSDKYRSARALHQDILRQLRQPGTGLSQSGRKRVLTLGLLHHNNIDDTYEALAEELARLDPANGVAWMCRAEVALKRQQAGLFVEFARKAVDCWRADLYEKDVRRHIMMAVEKSGLLNDIEILRQAAVLPHSGQREMSLWVRHAAALGIVNATATLTGESEGYTRRPMGRQYLAAAASCAMPPNNMEIMMLYGHMLRHEMAQAEVPSAMQEQELALLRQSFPAIVNANLLAASLGGSGTEEDIEQFVANPLEKLTQMAAERDIEVAFAGLEDWKAIWGELAVEASTRAASLAQAGTKHKSAVTENSKSARQRQLDAAESLGVPLEKRCDYTGMRFRLIPSGDFELGSTADEVYRQDNEGPRRAVTISEPFYMGVYPVTQAQYETVMGENPSAWKGENLPVESVSWCDAMEFCRRLSQQTGSKVSLPSEAMWEYACRAGTTSAYYFGEVGDSPWIDIVQDEYDCGSSSKNPLAKYAWFGGNSDDRTQAVGQKKPNVWGLHDMHGNVWEWCLDWYRESYCQDALDPHSRQEFGSRVIRGGSWGSLSEDCRSARRIGHSPLIPKDGIGFRVIVLPD